MIGRAGGPEDRARLHWIAVCSLSLCACLSLVCCGIKSFGQDEATLPAAVENSTSPTHDPFNATGSVPYRRVFVPASDLNAVQSQLPDHVPIDAAELKELLRKYGERSRAIRESMDMTADLALDSMHMVARLVGGDLVSTRSRLVLSRPYNEQLTPQSNRYVLKPWSMTFSESSLDSLVVTASPSPDVETPPTWVLDSAGMPVVFAPKANVSQRSDQSKAIHVAPNWFGWTLRSDVTSTANRLSYTLSVPRCPNAVLLLVLPPSAQITECTGIARKYSQWSEALERLGDWPENNVVSERESLWGIELTGSEKVSFSVSLSSGVLERSLEEGLLYEYLVREQRTEHILDRDTIRSITEIQLMNYESTRGPLRLTLPANARVRKIQVDQQEAGFQFEDGLIQVVTDVAGGDTKAGTSKPKSNRTVRVELLTPLSNSSNVSFDLPEANVYRSYVMSGSSTIAAVQPWRLTNVETLARRKSEKQDSNSVNRISQMEFNWSGKPTAIRLEATTSKRNGVAEVLNRVSHEESKQWVTSYIRLNPIDKSMPFEAVCVVDPAWKVEAATVVDPSSGVSVANSSSENGTILNVRSSSSPRDAFAQIEVRLSRVDSVPTDPSNVVNPKVISIEQWTQSDYFVVEHSGLLKFELPSQLVDKVVNEDALPAWQRERLPRLGRFMLLRSPSGRLPELRMVKSANRIVATVRTNITQQGKQLTARHTINARSPSGSFGNLIVDMQSEKVVWRVQSRGAWRTIDPQRGSSPASWVIDNSVLAASTVLEATVQWGIEDGNSKVPLPKVSNADETSYVVNCPPTLRLRGNTDQLQWDISEIGEVQLECRTGRDQDVVLSVEVSDEVAVSQNVLSESQLHVSIDETGTQLASVLLRNDHRRWNGLNLHIPDGWKPVSARWYGVTGRTEQLSFQTDKEIVSFTEGQLKALGSGEIDVALIGPELPSQGASKLTFEWPIIDVGLPCLEQSRHLWLPKSVGIANDSFSPNSDSPWLIWKWFQDVFVQVTGINPSIGQVKEWNERIGDVSSLRPSSQFDRLSRRHWRLAIADRGATVGATPTDRQSGAGIVLVGSRSQTTAMVFTFVVSLLLTPVVLGSRRWIGVVIATMVVVGAHWPTNGISTFCQFSLFGISFGYVLTILYQLTCSVRDQNQAAHKHTTKWIPWNDPRSNAPVAGNPLVSEIVQRTSGHSLLLAFLLGSGLMPILLSMMISVVSVREASGQRGVNSDVDAEQVSQILIPIDEQGVLSGTDCYVSKRLLSILKDDGQKSNFAESETQLISAKHSLRIDSRSGPFGTNDQLIQVYEIWVGDALQPVRFPMSNEQCRFARFIVDGMEVSVGSRLRKTDPELLWFPDKSGRRMVQIISYPRLRRVDADRSNNTTVAVAPADPKRLTSMQIDVSVLPAANSTMEVETDNQTTVEIQSQGRVSNPAIGRYNVMLGAVGQIKCSVFTTSAARAAVPTMPTEVTPSTNDEYPTISTEMLLDGEVVQARTVIDFPKNIELGREIEMEADSLWLPVGSRWGDARLLEVKPGSTLSRRRYVLQWNEESRGGSTAILGEQSSEAKNRQIVTIWVPQQTQASTVLNVLFAECRDRRVRPGTLRYSRSSGAVWTLEGVNTWIPAINARERLDWPELSNAPIATSLRVPQSGGFGVLRRQVTTGVAQARIANRWSMSEREDTLTVRIDLLGNMGAEPLQLQLPPGFVCQRAFNKSVSVPWLQSSSMTGERLQLLFDRTLVDTSEITVVATRQAQKSNLQSSSEANELVMERPIPVASLVGLSPIEQDLEVVVDPNWNVIVPVDTAQFTAGSFAGRVDGEPTLKLPVSTVSSLAAMRFVARNHSNTGALVLQIVPSDDQTLMGMLRLFVNTRKTAGATVAIDIPTRLINSWASDTNIVTTPSTDIGRTWMIVPLVSDSGKLPDSVRAVEVQFELPGDLESDIALFRSIRALDSETIPSFVLTTSDAASADVETSANGRSVDTGVDHRFVSDADRALVSGFMELGEHDVLLRNSAESDPVMAREAVVGVSPKCELALHRQLPTNSKDSETIVLESRYWIDPQSTQNMVNQTVDFSTVPGVTVKSISINGVSTVFEQSDSSVRCQFVHLGLAAEIVVQIEVSVSRLGGMTGLSLDAIASSLLRCGIGAEREIVVEAWPFHRAESHLKTVNAEQSKIWIRNAVGHKELGNDQRRESDMQWRQMSAEELAADVAELWLEMWNQSLLRMKKAEVLMNRSSVLIDWEQYFEASGYRYLSCWGELSSSSDGDAYGDAVSRYHSLQKEIGGPSVVRNASAHVDWLRRVTLEVLPRNGVMLQNGKVLEANPPVAIRGVVRTDEDVHPVWKMDWVSLVGCLMIVAVIVQIHRQMEQMLLDRPWWVLTMLGVLAWLLTGSIFPAAVFQLLSLLIATDSWWMVNERFRRTGIPVRR